MGWARLDDSFHDHPKVDGLSLAAVGLYALCLTWAHRHRRTAVVPGHITVARARKVAGPKMTALAAELVASGLWEDYADGWVIHDFTDYLPKERDPTELSTSGRKGAAKRWQTDGSLPSASHASAMQTDGKPMAEPMANDGSCASAPAFPTRPVPYPTQQPTSGGAELAPLDPPPDAGAIVAAFCDGATTAGLSRPGQSIRARVGKSARQLLHDGQNFATLDLAARRLGAGGWDDLEREVRRVEAERTPQPQRSTTTDRVTQSLNRAAELRAQESA